MHIIVPLLTLLLSACSTYKENFECPVGKGIRCASLSTINSKMTQGEIQLKEPSAIETLSHFNPDFKGELK